MSDTIKKVELGKVANVITKGTTPTSIGFDFTQTGINFIKIESISEEGNFIQSRIAHISEECNNKLKRSQLELNDILFSIAGAIGRVAKVTSDILPANTNQALALIRLKPGIFDYDFLCYYLQSQAIAEQYEKKKQGVAQLNISLNDISNFELPIMDFACQLKVVKYLNKVMHLIEKRKKQIEKLDELVRSRFVEMFGDINSECDLGDYILELRAGKSLAGVEDCKNKVLKTGAATLGFFDDNQVKNLPCDYVPNPLHKVETGDVIISRMNTPDLVGTCSYVWESPKNTYYPDRLWKTIVKPNVNPIFIWQLMQQSIIKKQIKEYSSGTSGSMWNISKPNLLRIKTVFVPFSLQNKFAEFVEKVEKTKSAIKKSLYSLETLKKSLMQKYFG